MKKFISVATAVIVLLTTSIQSHGEYEFDINYYMRKYPDIVQAFGNDADAITNHYKMYGYKEGRFANQQEEIDSMLPGYAKHSSSDNSDPAPATAPTSSTESNQNSISTSSSNDNNLKSSCTTIQPTKSTESSIIAGMSTYVDVDIASQTVTYYENGVAKLQCSCVTGNVSNGNGTPTGTYSIMTKVPGKYLIGRTWKCWVDRWMQFTPDHIGLHDANWRSSFGSDIYKTNGSHGCVNLPHDAATSLYDMVSVGTTVVVH